LNSARFAFAQFLMGSAILSAGPLLVRLADVGATQSAFWRLALAVGPLFLLAHLTARGTPSRQQPGDWRWLAAGGLFFAADLACWHLGILRTTLANSALFANATSFIYPIWGFAVARTWPTKRAAGALVLAASGIALLMGLSAEVSSRHLAGDLLCLLAAVFYTGYLVVMDRVRARVAALSALAQASLYSALAMLPVALLAPGSFWPGDWTPLLALALGSQVVGQGLIIFALPKLSPLASGLGLLIQPVLSATLGVIWFGEALSAPELLGMSAILTALVIVRWPERKAAA
jgi:drug/metabolite transporter (DMT)-like permease